jgi:hypothetical protein
MKIRNGFVSNSSSSSFCLVGVSREFEDIDNLINDNETLLKEEFQVEELDFDDSKYEYFEFLENRVKNSVESQVDWECEAFYCGTDIDKMQDHETLLEFKTRVCADINAKYGTTYTVKDMKILVETIGG